MRKIVMKAHADTVGTDIEELFLFPTGADGTEVSNTFLDEYAQGFGENHWESYNSSETEDEEDEYYQACGAWWEEYNEQEHHWMKPLNP